MFASLTTRRALPFALVVALLPSARAQDERFWSFLKKGTVVTRCAATSDAHRQASDRFERLDQAIERLKPTDVVAMAVGELHALLKTECYLAAAETERIPRPDTALSLKQWWSDAGGREWLASFLELPELGIVGQLKPHIVVPPDVRGTLNLESHSNHPLQRFLCPLTESSCGANTKGWRLRAEAYFEAHRALDQNSGRPTFDDRPPSGEPAISRACFETASERPPSEKYQAWRDCIEENRPKRVTLPLGEFRAPSEGWLVISGRRGHYTFCDSTRAYDLTTGAAFVDDSCSGLVLNADGSVDRDATNKGREEKVAVGHVSAQNLQEAVWMMLFRGEAAELQIEAAYFPLPPGLVPQFTAHDDRSTADMGMSFGGSTAQTILAWQWIPTKGTPIAGELTWPNSFDAAEDHAVSLLNVAESGFVEGCAQQRPPEVRLLRSSSAARLNDASSDDLRELVADYTRAMDRWRSKGRCEPLRQ